MQQEKTYVGPLDDQVYCIPGNFSLNEYSAVIISGETYAPTPSKYKTSIPKGVNLSRVNEFQKGISFMFLTRL